MADVKSEVQNIGHSVETELRNLIRFGTQDQADRASELREKLRLAEMNQALANLNSRNQAILALVSSLRTIVDSLRREPLGSALAVFRDALAECELLLDRVQHRRRDEATPVTEGHSPKSVENPAIAPEIAAPIPSPATVAPSGTAAPTNRIDPSATTSVREPEAEPPLPDLVLPAANKRFRPAILAAAKRCRLAPSALAALIDAEAAKRPDGGWDPNCANPRSSARGLTQFLSGTWIEMATCSGTFLNTACRRRGFVDNRNAVVASKRGELLDLRFDPEASIVTAADYAKQNLEFLAAHGCIPTDATDDEKARIAYLAHHEGAGGARAFLQGTLTEARAEQLLRVNSGSRAAALRRKHGSWRAAYVAFLNAYIDRKIRPARYRA